MTTGAERRTREPRIAVRETDEYVEHQEDAPPPDPPSPWVRSVFQPAAVGVLVACVAWSVARVIDVFTQLSHVTLFWLVPAAMALVGFTTQRIVQRRFHSGSDSLRFRIVELGVMFLAVKVAGLLGDTVPEVLAAARAWSLSPLTFFDATTMIAFLLGAIAWLMAGLTARDLDALVDPMMYLGETEPTTRLVKRYFAGGAILLICTAISRVDLGTLIEMENARIRTPILSVLLYFFLGVVMLGQIQFSRLSGLWRREKVTVVENLSAHWIRYTLAFIALAALIAFVLPTGYTVSILDLVATLIYVISYAALILYTLVLWPFAMLLALVSGKKPTVETPSASNVPFAPPPLSASDASGGAWWAVVRSIVFWVVLLSVVFYLVRSYLRDRPELGHSLRRFAPWRWLAEAWRTIGRWFLGWGRTLGEAVPALVRRVLRPRARTRNLRRARGRSLREQLRYAYLVTLDRAGEEGVPRRQTETPYEYSHKLDRQLAEGSEALEALTQAFVEARYSTHPVTAEDVATQEANAEKVRRGLRPDNG